MADEDLHKILEAWGLAEYIQVFTDNKINADTLLMLDAELCRELIKPIGDRAKFLKNLEEFKKLSSNEPTEMELSFLDVDILNDSHRLSHINDIMVHDVEIPVHDVADAVDNRRDKPQTKPLKELLQKTNEGRGILNLYEEEGKLSSNGRRKLCNIIITSLLEKNPEQRISSETLLSKAQEIKSVFGKENIYTYFIPYIHNTKLKIKRCAKGKLYDCLQNKRRQYREAKVIEQKQTTIAIPGTSGTTSSVNKELIPTVKGAKNNIGVYGGDVISIKEAPWTSLVYTSEDVFCAGAIIDRQFILTVDTCCNDNGATPRSYWKVRVGSNGRGGGVSIKVQDAYKYKKSGEDYNLKPSLCLLKLENPLIYNEKIQQVGLEEPIIIENGTELDFTAYGRPDLLVKAPGVLLKSKLVVVDAEWCKEENKRLGGGQICAGNQEHNACAGDAGGALTSGRYLVGVLSEATSDCHSNPSRFCRISHYTPWIRKTIKDHQTLY